MTTCFLQLFRAAEIPSNSAGKAFEGVGWGLWWTFGVRYVFIWEFQPYCSFRPRRKQWLDISVISPLLNTSKCQKLPCTHCLGNRQETYALTAIIGDWHALMAYKSLHRSFEVYIQDLPVFHALGLTDCGLRTVNTNVTGIAYSVVCMLCGDYMPLINLIYLQLKSPRCFQINHVQPYQHFANAFLSCVLVPWCRSSVLQVLQPYAGERSCLHLSCTLQ